MSSSNRIIAFGTSEQYAELQRSKQAGAWGGTMSGDMNFCYVRRFVAERMLGIMKSTAPAATIRPSARCCVFRGLDQAIQQHGRGSTTHHACTF